MTTRTRKAPSATPAGTPAKRAAAKKTPAARTPRKKTTTTKKAQPRLSLVKPVPARPELPTRTREFITDAQIYATHAARQAGLPIHRIRDWADQRNEAATRHLTDGSLLHYDHATRTLTWHSRCPMGAPHQYVLTTPSTAAFARVDIARCQTPHADLSTIPPLTADELAALGLLNTPTWARPDLLGDEITETIPVTLPAKPRAIADQLAHSTTSTTDTQPLPAQEIADGLTARADHDQMKEHPQP